MSLANSVLSNSSSGLSIAIVTTSTEQHSPPHFTQHSLIMSGNGDGSSSSGGDKKYDPYTDPGERQEDLADLSYRAAADSQERHRKQKEEKERVEEEKKTIRLERYGF